MLYEQLYDLLHREPFQPFWIHLKDGRVFDIRFARTNLLGRRHITIGIPLPDDPHPTRPLCDPFETVEFWQIDRVETMPAPAAATKG